MREIENGEAAILDKVSHGLEETQPLKTNYNLMKTTKTKLALWIGGLAAGVAAGALIYQNREKLGPQKEKLSKLLGELQKTGEELGKKIKAAGLESIERGKALTQSTAEKLN